MFSAAQLFRRPTRNSFTGTQRSPRILWHTIRKNFKHFQWISLEARLMHSAQLRENSALSFSLAFSLPFSLTLFVLSLSLFLLVVLLSVYLAKETFVYIFDETVKAKMQQPAKVSGKTLQENIAHTQEKEQRKRKRKKKRERQRGRAQNRVKVSESESTNIYEMLKVLMPKCLLTQIENVEEIITIKVKINLLREKQAKEVNRKLVSCSKTIK